jgi:hypothetical protein
MDGMIILGILLFIVAVAEVCMYISLVRMRQRLPEPRRTVEREKIPADWNRIMEETTIEKKRRTK